jgi:hypothetical protein
MQFELVTPPRETAAYGVDIPRSITQVVSGLVLDDATHYRGMTADGLC